MSTQQKINILIIVLNCFTIPWTLYSQNMRGYEYSSYIHNSVHQHLDSTSLYNSYKNLDFSLFVNAVSSANLLSADFWFHSNRSDKIPAEKDNLEKSPEFHDFLSDIAMLYVFNSEDWESLTQKFQEDGSPIYPGDFGVFFYYMGFTLGSQGSIGGGIYASSNILEDVNDDHGNKLDLVETLNYQKDRKEAVLTGLSRLNLGPLDFRYEWNIYGDKWGKIRFDSDFLSTERLQSIPFIKASQLIQESSSPENFVFTGFDRLMLAPTRRMSLNFPFELHWGDDFTFSAKPEVHLDLGPHTSEHQALLIRMLIEPEVVPGFSVEYRYRFSLDTSDTAPKKGPDIGLSLYASWNDTYLVPFSELQNSLVLGVRYFARWDHKVH